MCGLLFSAGILKQSMAARNREGITLYYSWISFVFLETYSHTLVHRYNGIILPGWVREILEGSMQILLHGQLTIVSALSTPRGGEKHTIGLLT